MSIEQLDKVIDKAGTKQLRQALRLLLSPHAELVFGAAKAIEHEVAAFNALKALGYVDQDSDEFDLVDKLRITKNKARSLLYQVALRAESSPADVDAALCKALQSTRPLRDGSMYLIEVPDPLTMDRLRKRIRDYGYLSDGTFSGSIAKIPEGALVRLIEELISVEVRAEIRKRLIEAGMEDMSVAGAIKAVLGKIGKKALDDVGEQAGKAVGEEIAKMLTAGWNTMKMLIVKE